MSRAKLVIGGTLTYLTAVGAGYVYTSYQKAKETAVADVHLLDGERKSIYSKNAAKYDSDIGMDETLMGLNLLRWHYVGKAKGKVLEIGCGTGRNFSFYSRTAVQSITAVDYVPEMVAQAQKKVSDDSRISVQVMDAHHLSFSDNEFDTVVDTFGLCSFEDPVAVLREMSRVCRPGGKILLLEHGRSKSTSWINTFIDSGAQMHAHNWGCIYNRDIEELVGKAGLKIANISNWHFGTTYVIEAVPINK